MQGTQYATKRSISLCRGAFCGPTELAHSFGDLGSPAKK